MAIEGYIGIPIPCLETDQCVCCAGRKLGNQKQIPGLGVVEKQSIFSKTGDGVGLFLRIHIIYREWIIGYGYCVYLNWSGSTSWSLLCSHGLFSLREMTSPDHDPKRSGPGRPCECHGHRLWGHGVGANIQVFHMEKRKTVQKWCSGWWFQPYPSEKYESNGSMVSQYMEK